MIHCIPVCSTPSGSNVDLFPSPDTRIERQRVYIARPNHHRDPMQRLPVELITTIFDLCLPPLPSLDVFAGRHERQDHIPVRPMQFLLGSICQFWRKVVCSTPQLWNTLLLRVSARTTAAQSDLVAEGLRRSAPLPLDIFMSYFDEGRPNTLRSLAPFWLAINRMIDTLCLYASRIRTLHLRLFGSHISHFGHNRTKPLGDVDASKSILQKLSIDVLDRGPDIFRTRFGLDGRMLEPTQVCFRGILPTSIRIDWGRVTCIELAEIETRDAFMVLQSTPRLKRLKISVMEYQVPPVPITHHSLKVLQTTSDSDLDFLEYLKCPVLEELSCYPDFTVRSFLKNSLCPLRKLSLEGSDEDLVPLLHLTPFLTHLTLDNFGIPDELLGSFAETDSFLPHLRCLVSNGIRLCQFRWSKIPSLIRSSPLSDINITFDAQLENEVMDRDSLVETVQLVQDRQMVLKVHDSEGNDLICWSSMVHGMIDASP